MTTPPDKLETPERFARTLYDSRNRYDGGEEDWNRIFVPLIEQRDAAVRAEGFNAGLDAVLKYVRDTRMYEHAAAPILAAVEAARKAGPDA